MLDRTDIPDTIISRWGTKPKFISFVLLMFVFAGIKSLALLPLVLLIATGLFLLSRVPVRFLLRRLKLPALFIGMMALLLVFFTQGQVVGACGPFMVTREGLASALLMAGRCVAILTIIVILFYTSAFLEVLAVMHSLGIPEVLTDMLLFTHRYLHETAVMFRQMHTALALRGFAGRRCKALIVYSYLAGTIFIRSYEQSQRLYQAMMLRGYGRQPVKGSYRKAGSGDQALAAMLVILSLALGSLQILLLYPGG